jgi:hypothetical protein
VRLFLLMNERETGRLGVRRREPLIC